MVVMDKTCCFHQLYWCKKLVIRQVDLKSKVQSINSFKLKIMWKMAAHKKGSEGFYGFWNTVEESN